MLINYFAFGGPCAGVPFPFVPAAFARLAVLLIVRQGALGRAGISSVR